MAEYIKKHFWDKWPSEGMKSAVAYTFVSLFSKGLAFVTVSVFTRIMSTSEVSTVNLYNSWRSTLTVVATLSLTYGGYMVTLREYEHERDRYEFSVLTLTTFTLIVFFAIYSVAPNFWSRILGLDKSLLLPMLVDFLLLPTTEFWLARQRYEHKYKAATLATIGSAIVASALSIVAVLYTRGSGEAAEGRLFANYATLYAIAFVLWVCIMVRGREFISMRYWKFSLALSVPFIANQFTTQILNNSGRVMIGWFVDNSAVDIYGTLSPVSTVSAIVWLTINSSFIPFLYRSIDDSEDKKRVQSLASILLLTYAAVCVLMTFLAPKVAKIIVTDEYMAAIYIMLLISTAIFQNAISNMYANMLLYHKKFSYIMTAFTCGTVPSTILNAVLIPPSGCQATAYSMLIAFVFLSYVQMRMSEKPHFIITGTKETVYDDKVIIGTQWLVIMFSATATPLYHFTTIRCITAFVLMVAPLLLYKKSKISI